MVTQGSHDRAAPKDTMPLRRRHGQKRRDPHSFLLAAENASTMQQAAPNAGRPVTSSEGSARYRSASAMNRNGAPPVALSAAMIVRAPFAGSATEARLMLTFAAREAGAVPAGTART